ncbi:MAG: phenylalanine--tRNA ligase subunit beta [Alphaproteobacteria bacterium 41-28]|nr:MAG: phenylalanine--tRNA ligase subunit beta [Alphaproteobacteria bacterium 41-28]
MKFTLSWLKDHLETEASLELILEKLTALGLVVDKVENKAEALAPFKICEILEAEKHPNADRLQVCRVNTGTEVIQVVCGAPNARKGLKAVLARPGDVIPSTKQVLKVGKVRDVESFGMMCSAEELHLGERAEGIIEVDRDAPVGEPYAKWIGFDDILIEIEVTPNRGDCLGVYGIARDLAATGIGKLQPLKVERIKGSYPCPISLKTDPEACPYFTGRVIRGLKNGSSPLWLQKKLEAIGLRPISALVDITNFFTHDRARPLHVFDADKLKGNLNIRLSKEGESFIALDGKTYTLSDDMTVIADDSGVISLAGIMGGESTGCGDATHTIFLESAFFDPIRIAITGRSLGILSDSRYRFERGVDPASTLPGLEAATQMILEICGGDASDVIIAGKEPDLRASLTFEPSRIKTLGGLEVSSQRAQDVLTNLGFEVKGQGNNLTVVTPTWRPDVEQEADLVEEVLRVEGYDKIPSTPYEDRPEQKPLSLLQEQRFVARAKLANRGLTEVITWSFMEHKDTELFGGAPENLVLLNPISQDLDTMRPSLLPNLLKALLLNQNRGAEAVGLFEVGPQFSDPTPQGQHMMVSGIRAGVLHSDHWLEKKRPVDIYDIKADIIYVLSGIAVQYDQTAPLWYHPGRSATLKLGPNVLGYFGELHPRILKDYDVKGPVVAFEIFIDRIPLLKRKSKSKLTLSPYQRVERDFAFVFDKNILAENLIKAVQKADPVLIKGINLFDVFTLEDDKKSIAIRVTLQPQDRTLTEEEIQAISQKIISSVAQSTGGVLRQ